MDPLSSVPPYSPRDIEEYVYQLPHKHIIHQQVEVVQLQTPFDLMRTQESKQAELNKKKNKEREKKDKKKSS